MSDDWLRRAAIISLGFTLIAGSALAAGLAILRFYAG
jgi:hypothetical protein